MIPAANDNPTRPPRPRRDRDRLFGILRLIGEAPDQTPTEAVSAIARAALVEGIDLVEAASRLLAANAVRGRPRRSVARDTRADHRAVSQ